MVLRTVNYLLDTDISSYIIKHKPPQVKHQFDRLLPNEMAISAITQAELLYGLKKLPSEHVLQSKVKQYLQLMHVLDWSADASPFYADIHDYLRTSGQLIGEMDMLIASHALAINAKLVTNNVKHYQRIVDGGFDLQLDNWA